MESFRDKPGMASVALCRSRFGVVVHHACDRVDGEAGALPELPTLGFVHRGVGELQLTDRMVYADPTQVVLRGGGTPFRIRHHRCAGRVCVTTVSLTREGVVELSRRFGLGTAALRRLFSDQLVSRGASIQRRLHLLIVDSMAGSDLGNIDEGILELFREGISLASAPKGARDDDSRAARTVRRARLILADCLERAPRLDELASAVDCSRFYLCHIFKARTGMTVTDYVHRLRLNEALLELQLGADDLSRLAFRLGYSSHSHFTSRFRRFYGMTPSMFRDRIRRLASSSGPLPMAILHGQWRQTSSRDPRSAACSWNGTPATSRRSQPSFHW